MPVVVSVGFFVIYYIITITGEKMAREGSWDSFLGMWIATFILLPISVYLTYKATNDSNLFNAEWYLARYKKISAFFRSPFPAECPPGRIASRRHSRFRNTLNKHRLSI